MIVSSLNSIAGNKLSPFSPKSPLLHMEGLRWLTPYLLMKLLTGNAILKESTDGRHKTLSERSDFTNNQMLIICSH